MQDMMDEGGEPKIRFRPLGDPFNIAKPVFIWAF